jgi:HD-like signal output (HDOD) protein
MSTNLERFMEDASRIPAAPGVAMELARSCDSPSTTIDQLVAILRCDPGLTAKLLRMANSAYFASRREIGELSEAIVRLGLRRVQTMAMAFCIMEATCGARGSKREFDYTYYWNHALITATFADVVAETLRLKRAPEAMVAGLLQDLGVLVIQTSMPKEYRAVLATQKRSGEDLHLAELRRLGFNHMQVGEMLLRRWHIPDAICQVVGHHHQVESIEAAGDDVYRLACTCQVGSVVAKYLTHDTNRPKLLARAAELAGQNLGIDREKLQGILGLIRMRIESSADMLDVHLNEAMILRLDAAIRDRIAENILELTDIN